VVGAGDAVKKLAGRIGALIATTLMAKGLLAEDEFHAGISGTYGTRTSMKLFEEADCVIAVGASMGRYTTEHGYLYPNARFVHLDSKPHLVMSGGRSADCYVQTDAKAGVEALENALAKRSVKMTGFRTEEVKKQLATQHVDRTEFRSSRAPWTREICLRWTRCCPRNRRGHGQRRHCGFLEHAVQQAALAGAAGISSAASGRCCRRRSGDRGERNKPHVLLTAMRA
jgi:thiamine pyrophosphate-dependent acetolactate synthase large subunit-like protein